MHGHGEMVLTGLRVIDENQSFGSCAENAHGSSSDAWLVGLRRDRWVRQTQVV
jgi:hypothetical protein